MAVEVTPLKQDSISYQSLLAAANIHINSITPVNRETVSYRWESGRGQWEDTEDTFINIAVSYEFQWKNRGNYIWERMSDIFTVSSRGDAITEEKQLYSKEGDGYVQFIDMGEVYMDIYDNVIQYRSELEDPDDRGRYTYYLGER